MYNIKIFSIPIGNKFFYLMHFSRIGLYRILIMIVVELCLLFLCNLLNYLNIMLFCSLLYKH